MASSDVQAASLRSKISLLDWDIVLVNPSFDEFLIANFPEHYKGKRCLDDSSSFGFKDCCDHWRREIKQAVHAGKTVIVFLPPLQEVFVDTGNRDYSGRGRNRVTIRKVEPYDNYRAIPVELSPVASSGRSMRLSARGAGVLGPYWAEFGGVSRYEVVLTDPKVPACVVTTAGGKTVGAIYHGKSSAGALLLLPYVNVRTFGTRAPAARLVSSLVGLKSALRATADVTPEPAWAAESRFALSAEGCLRARLLEAERDVERSHRHKEQIAEELRSAAAFRRLLYEKGKPLESVVIEALRVLGFSAVRFKESDSEFDVVFESSEGRLIGEAEGKDNKAVNVDKLRQLSMNVHEDLQREEIAVPAKPVLFGNAFRLLPLAERADPFTEKCHIAAARSSTALAFTPDLFRCVQYLLANPDAEYARACRQALLQSTGRVMFPSPPTEEQTQYETRVEEAE